jgi:hypothetical protein
MGIWTAEEGEAGTALDADQAYADRGLAMASRFESRENGTHEENETGGRNQHWKRPLLFRADRGQVRQSIPAHCRDQEPQQAARYMEGTRRGAAQEEHHHSDSESGLAVNKPGKLDSDGVLVGLACACQ